MVTVRNLGRAIAAGSEPDELAQRAATAVVDGGVFHNACVINLEGTRARAAGVGAASLRAASEGGEPPCVRDAIDGATWRARAGCTGCNACELGPDDVMSSQPLVREGVRHGTLLLGMPAAIAALPLVREVVDGLATDLGAAFVRPIGGPSDAERRMRLLVDNTPSSAALFDRDMRYLAVSPRFLLDLRMPGEPSDYLHRSHYDVFPDMPPHWRAIHQRCLAGATERGDDEPYPRADGTVDWVSWLLRPWHEADGSIGGLLLLGEVVTDRHRTQAELVASQSHLASVLASIQDLVFGLDEDGRFVDFHAPDDAVLLLPPSEFIGRRYQDVLPAEVADRVTAAIAELARGARSAQFEYRMDLAGIPTWWSARASRRPSSGPGAASYTLVSRDVTAARLAADALRASEERYRLLVDNIDDIVFTVGRDGRITYVNRAVEQFGYRPEELLGRHRDEFIHPDEIALTQANAAATLAAPPGTRRIAEYRLRDARGTWRTVRSSTRATVRGGEILGLTGVVQDLTAQRATEEQLRVAQRMEAVGRLAGGVAHDFNNLLTVILSYTSFAKDQVEPESSLHDDLSEVEEAAHRAESLTRQLLAFSRRQVLRPELLVLDELLDGLAKMLRRLIGEDVELVIVPADHHHHIVADRGQIEQVTMNLIVNARDAMPDGGRITLRVEDATIDDAEAEALDIQPGPYVALVVSDSGHGMTAAVQSRVFEPFFTTKPVGKGTGLGLSMVYGLVRQSGGAITVDSAPGRGATFRIVLPRASADQRVPSGGAVAGRPSPARGRGLVVFVEDEPALRLAGCRMLEAAGYLVAPAASAAETLTLVDKFGPQIRLVVTDVVMPGLSGKALAAQLADKLPGVPVIFTSGYTDDTIARHGVVGPYFLPKPYDASSLTGIVRRVLDSQSETTPVETLRTGSTD